MVFDRRIRAALAALLLTFMSTFALAVVDRAVCSPSDPGSSSCTKAQMLTSVNEEVNAVDTRAPMVLGSVSGTDTIVGSVTPTLTAYADGQSFRLKPANDTTSTVTLNINSIGAKALVSRAGAALSSGDLLATTLYTVTYYAASDQFRVMSPVGASSGTVTSVATGNGLTGGTITGTGTLSLDFSDAGASPSLSADTCRFSGDATTNGELVCEGDTADAFETRMVITDPTADRAFTIPNADSVATQPATCTGNDHISAISSLGALTCTHTQETLGCYKLSDETTAITTGTKLTVHVPYAFTLTSVTGSLNTVSSSGTPTFDIKEDTDAEGAGAAATIFSTKPTIDVSELRTSSAAAASVLSDTAIAANSMLSMSIDVAGTGAKGAMLCLIGYQ